MATPVLAAITVESVVFVVCAVIVLVGGAGVVLSRNPVHSALSLVATLFGIAVLFLNLNAQLLAAVQVIVYTGAIVVLILFVMMLLGVDTEDDLSVEPIVGQWALAAVGVLAVLGPILAVLVISQTDAVTGARSVTEAIAADGYDNINQLGRQLFTTYVFPLEITAGLLTIAVVGAVVLSRRPRDVQPVPEPESMIDTGDEPLTAAPAEPTTVGASDGADQAAHP